MALAFVPENEVLPCIMKLLSDQQTVFLVQQFPKIADFLKYFHRTLISTFEISMWNVLDREPILRTNGCEAWNSTWNRDVQKKVLNNSLKFFEIFSQFFEKFLNIPDR